MNQYQNAEWEILDAMEGYGGGFIKALARCYANADFDNRIKLAEAFKDIFLEYDRIVTQVKQNGHHSS